MGFSERLISAASVIVPADQRDEWRREWSAELSMRPASLKFALGAPLHAMWLRKERWRPSLLMTDLRFGVRQLRRRPGLAAAAILTLAIGAGATTAIFSVVYGVLLKPLPYREPTTLVQLWEINPRFNWTEAAIAPGNLLSWRERNRSFSDIGYYYATGTREGGLQSLTLGGDDPTRVLGLSVSPNFFDVLGSRPALGRTFAQGEDVLGHNRIVVLSDRFWHARFGGDPNVLESTVTLNGLAFKVVGVMNPAFRFDAARTDLWLPIVLNLADLREVRRPHYLRAVARLKPGVTMDQARADISGIARDLEKEYPNTNAQMSASLGPVDDWFVGETRRPLLLFLGAVAVLLLIACANVTNLMLARSLERVGEMSVRAALGASRARLVRQLLVESLVIATLGGALGLALAIVSVKTFVTLAPVSLPRLDDVAVDPAVWLFCLGLTAATTVVVGLVPALWGARSGLRESMGSARTATGRAPWVRRVLVGAEVALAVILVIGATLTLRSFVALMRVEPGFPVETLTSARVSLPKARYRDPGKAATFFEDVSSRLRGVAGVTAAGAAAQLPLEGASWTSQFYIEGRPDFHGFELRHKAVTAGYLETLGVQLLSGRTIAKEDRMGVPFAVVVNETFVKRYVPSGDAVGMRITWDVPSPTVPVRTVVGVVSDEPQDGIGQPAAPEVYYALQQEERSEMAVLVRSSRPSDQMLTEIRRTVRDVDPQLALFDAGSMTDKLSQSLAKPRVAAWLVGGFAAVALLLAVIGIYGVTAWAVAVRRREFSIRVACGARRTDVFRLVMRQDLTVVAFGMIAGVIVAALVTRAASSLLFGVTAGDWVSYAAGLSVLFAAGVAACFGPARRASKVDPASIMRN